MGARLHHFDDDSVAQSHLVQPMDAGIVADQLIDVSPVTGGEQFEWDEVRQGGARGGGLMQLRPNLNTPNDTKGRGKMQLGCTKNLL